MSQPISHEELRDHYELYALGLLEPGPEKDAIDEHMTSGCAECSSHMKEALAIQAMMLSHAPDVVPPSRIRRRVMGAVGEAPGMGWTWLATSVAAGLLVVSLWFSMESRARQQEIERQQVALNESNAARDRLQSVFLMLAEPETKQVTFGPQEEKPVKGNVYINPRLGVTLIASNLPPLAESETYEMWIVPKEGAPRPAGLFRSNMGEAMHVLAGPIDVAQVAAVAVTVEPAGGSPAPTKTPLIVAAPKA